MKKVWLAIALLSLAAQAQVPSVVMAPALIASDPGTSRAPAVPSIQVDFNNPGLLPPQWTLILRPDGSGHFRTRAGANPAGGLKEIEVQKVDRDVRVSPAFAARLFETAERHKWFNEPCESHSKVAFQGVKTLAYSGPGGRGSCSFNYSKDKEIQSLAESLQAVAQTLIEGARIEILLQHDRLGLDQEMEYLTTAASDGRVQEICAIRAILERLAQDSTLLERVRKRARMLLAKAST
jgi:hypothetical protein